MARPKTDIKLLKSVHISFRTTADNYRIVAHNASSYGISIADYIRKRITNKPLPRYKISPYERNIFIELSRIGNNINQLTRKIHSGNPQYGSLGKELIELREILDTLKTKIIVK